MYTFRNGKWYLRPFKYSVPSKMHFDPPHISLLPPLYCKFRKTNMLKAVISKWNIYQFIYKQSKSNEKKLSLCFVIKLESLWNRIQLKNCESVYITSCLQDGQKIKVAGRAYLGYFLDANRMQCSFSNRSSAN